MKYSIIHPDSKLKNHVQYFWTLEVNQGSCERDIRTFVDDSTGILMEFSTGDDASSLRRTMIYGQTTTPTLNQNRDAFLGLGILFHPYAIHELFQLNASELTNRRICLNDFLGGRIAETIAFKTTQSGKFNFLSTYLFNLISRNDPGDNLIRHCIRTLSTEQEW